MDSNGRFQKQLSPQEATLEAPSFASLSGTPVSDSSGPRVNIVEGSGPELTCEMRGVLRSRLRLAALVLYVGFTFFWLWWTFHLLTDGMKPNITSMWLLYGSQIAVSVVLGFLALTMCRKCAMSTFTLRVKESIIFGLPSILFVMMQLFKAPLCAEEHQFMPNPAVPWLLLMFTYALFIPNSWKRAAAVIGSMAVTPVMLSIYLWLVSTHCQQELAEQVNYFPELIIGMLTGAISSVAGVYTIGSLRTEAFKAKQLGQYNLRELIGAGGMGEVYLAEHRLLKRPCAIKLIRPEKAGDPKTIARFEREVRASAKLSHWNSIEIFDYGHAEDGTFYYVMEYLPGMNLHEMVQRFGPLPPERVIHLLMQTCDALAEAHGMCLVHRDIKPANIFAAQRGGLYDVAKLLDFGLVKPMFNMEETQLTQEGAITGSPLFMSPEQATGDAEPDERSDIYSLGGVAYYLLSGRPLFDYEQPLKVLLAHARELPRSFAEFNLEIPRDLESIVMKCLEKDPADRYQSVLDLRDALADCESAGHWTRRLAAQWWTSRDDGKPMAEAKSSQSAPQPSPQPAGI